MANFAIMGVGGYIAPRHLEAIKDGGHQLMAAMDVNDSVGILDRYFPDVPFFTNEAALDTHLKKLKSTPQKVEFVAITSPNYLHAKHIELALTNGAHAICEKPLVLTTKELDHLNEISRNTDRHVYTILQLRVHEAILSLKAKIAANPKRHKVKLTYMTSRGPWYLASWKGNLEKSGGLATNIGIHFFDMLTWIFGSATKVHLDERTVTLERGRLELERADVEWLLTIDRTKLPPEAVRAGKSTFRSIQIDGEEFEFSEGFTELHKVVYKQIMSGQGYGIEDARAAIELAEQLRLS